MPDDPVRAPSSISKHHEEGFAIIGPNQAIGKFSDVAIDDFAGTKINDRKVVFLVPFRICGVGEEAMVGAHHKVTDSKIISAPSGLIFVQ
jgi:hypothetical protein